MTSLKLLFFFVFNICIVYFLFKGLAAILFHHVEHIDQDSFFIGFLFAYVCRFIAFKMAIEEPENKVYFNCIGRYVKGKGCNWSLGVVVKDMKLFPVFEMAEEVVAESAI